MQKRELQKILRKIAKGNSTTPEYVYQEMQLAIDAAQNSPDPAIRVKWDSIPKSGDKHTVEDFLEYMVFVVKMTGF